MPASYSQGFALSTDTVFIGQVLIAMLKYAATVLSESTAIAGHQQRGAMAVQVITNPDTYKQKVAYAVCCTSTILNLTPPLIAGTNPTDAQVDTAVVAIWNYVSGYFPN